MKKIAVIDGNSLVKDVYKRQELGFGEYGE